MKLSELEKLAQWHQAMAKEPKRNQAKRDKHFQTAAKITEVCAIFREMLDALKQASEATAYVSHDDTVGYRVCCQVVSYKPHTKDCDLMAVIKKAEEML